MRAPIILLVFILPFYLCAKPKEKHKKMAFKDNLAAYYNMEQNAALGFPIHDHSGNGNHLTAYGSPILAPGKLGQGIQFDGSTQWLEIASNAGVNHNGRDFTGMVLFKPLALVGGELIIGSVDWGVLIAQSGGNYYVNVQIEDGNFNITEVPLVVGQWYCVMFGWYESNGSYAWGTVNHSQRVRESRTVWTDPEGAFKIAGNNTGNRLNAVVDEVAIWHRNVPAHEFDKLFNNGNGLPFEEWDTATPCKAIDCCD